MKRRTNYSQLRTSMTTALGSKYQFTEQEAEHIKKAIDGLFMLRSAIIKFREVKPSQKNIPLQEESKSAWN